VGVTGYYLSTSSSTPAASVSGWVSVTPATSYSGSPSYTLSSGEGEKKVYVWYKDAVGNVSASASDTITMDTTKPTGSININSGESYTKSTTVKLALSASDSQGVTGYYTSTSENTPLASSSGWLSISSTLSYSNDSNNSYRFSSDGSRILYVWYKDAAGNVSNSVSDTIILDTTVPTVSITSPTSNASYTTTSISASLSGSASDATSGIKNLTWSNSAGGNGTASGTTNWTASSIRLLSGTHIITVTATDNAGNTGTDTITIRKS